MQKDINTDVEPREQDQPRLLDTIALEKAIQQQLLAAKAAGVDHDLALFVGQDLTCRVSLRVTEVRDGLIFGTMLDDSNRFGSPSSLTETVIRVANVGMVGRIIPVAAKSQS
jgi:hypothetical protein